LDSGDVNYDVSMYGGSVDIGTEDTDKLKSAVTPRMLDSVLTAAKNLAQTHLDRVVFGLDNDSISTLDTGVSSWIASRIIGVTMGVPNSINRAKAHSPSSDVTISG